MKAIDGHQGVLHVADVAELCGMDWGSAHYHLDKEVKTGLLAKVGQSAYLFRNGADPEFPREQFREAGLAQGRS